jgi:hypothetical protein
MFFLLFLNILIGMVLCPTQGKAQRVQKQPMCPQNQWGLDMPLDFGFLTSLTVLSPVADLLADTMPHVRDSVGITDRPRTHPPNRKTQWNKKTTPPDPPLSLPQWCDHTGWGAPVKIQSAPRLQVAGGRSWPTHPPTSLEQRVPKVSCLGTTGGPPGINSTYGSKLVYDNYFKWTSKNGYQWHMLPLFTSFPLSLHFIVTILDTM